VQASRFSLMDHLDGYNRVMLVQADLAEPLVRAQLQQARDLLATGQGPLLVFFHARAAALEERGQVLAWAGLAAAHRDDLSLAVCQAARSRRVDAAPPAPFRTSTLVRFWAAALGATELLAPHPVAVQTGGVLLRIRRAADPPESRELLELVLAAASLELDVVVCFEAEALSMLAGEQGAGWFQLRDHELARMVTTAADPAELECIDSTALARWQAERTVLEA
jgi:hypothetical protein